MLTINYSARFKRDYKIVKKRGYDIALLKEVLELLCIGQPLPQKYRDHALPLYPQIRFPYFFTFAQILGAAFNLDQSVFEYISMLRN